MDRRDAPRSGKFRHVFLDAEGTLYVPRGGKLLWEFWANPSPETAVEFFELDEGVLESLLKLREQVDTLCLVSRNPWPILSAILRKYGIDKSFDAIMLNGDKGKNISRYLAKHGFDKTRSVMVGDMPELDLFPVLRAGVEAILIDRWYNRSVVAERIKGLRELPAWLRLADIAEDMERDRARNSTLDDFLGRGTESLIAVRGT